MPVFARNLVLEREDAMPKMVSATEAKNRLGALFSWIQDNQDTVIVESRGEPTAVIMSYSEYEKIQALQEQARRQEIWERMEALRREISARNQDLTEEQKEQLADEVSREAINSLVKKGKIKFAPPAP
jgi:prevent-host-death family protein